MPIACITGASSGIGREFAKCLAERGFQLLLVARNTQALEALKSELETSVEIITCDLSSEVQTFELADRLKEYKIDLLINNAGFGDVGDFDRTGIAKDIDMIHVNIKALHILMKKLLPGFVKRDRGYILNVASSAGLLPGGPHMATYYATKAYVVSLTSAVSHELKERGSDVHISALCPGPVDSNFNQVAGVQFSLPGISAAYCAEYGLKMLAKGKLIIVPTLTMKVATVFTKALPRKMALHLIARQQQKKTDMGARNETGK